MRIAVVTGGLPGAGCHGGAITVWAIIRAARARGHDVAVLSLYDTSPENPYHDHRIEQVRALEAIGVRTVFVDAAYPTLRSTIPYTFPERFSALRRPPIERYFPWAKVRSDAERALRAIAPDVIFVYHFDVLAAVYQTSAAPVVAGVGDLWHDPPYYRWRLEHHRWQEELRERIRYVAFARAMRQAMVEMLSPCIASGAFAAHYAAWLRDAGVPDMRYFRTPVIDLLPNGRRSARSVRVADHPMKVVLLGNLVGTASRWGQQFLAHEVLPLLDRLPHPPFEIHVIGRGEYDPSCVSAFRDRPYVVRRGYVEDLDAELGGADVVIDPTPIPLGIRTRLITAFSCGCAVITHVANRSGIPEIVDCSNALVVSDGPSFARAITRLLSTPALADCLRVAARQTYDKFFTEERAGGAIVTTMEDAVIRVRS